MAVFPTTHWSLLAKASLSENTESRKALEDLCRRYWGPVHQFIRSRGAADPGAEDLTQEFMMHVLEKAFFARADPLQGRFRSFLLGALVKFLSHERERRLAQKRGGSHPHVSAEMLAETGELCDPTPGDGEVAAFDRNWALTTVRSALASVEREYGVTGKSGLFTILRAFLPGGNVPLPYEEAAARAGMSVAALNSEIHRLRLKFRECVYAEVTATVSAPHEIDEELAHLHRVLMDRGTQIG
jgi:RNA polymerase sigma-70 factor (ECF subfamily)